MTTQPEALALAEKCEESATEWRNEIDTRKQAATLLRAQHAEIAALQNGLALALHDAMLIKLGEDDDATRQATARIDMLVKQYIKQELAK